MTPIAVLFGAVVIFGLFLADLGDEHKRARSKEREEANARLDRDLAEIQRLHDEAQMLCRNETAAQHIAEGQRPNPYARHVGGGRFVFDDDAYRWALELACRRHALRANYRILQ